MKQKKRSNPERSIPLTWDVATNERERIKKSGRLQLGLCGAALAAGAVTLAVSPVSASTAPPLIFGTILAAASFAERKTMSGRCDAILSSFEEDLINHQDGVVHVMARTGLQKAARRAEDMAITGAISRGTLGYAAVAVCLPEVGTISTIGNAVTVAVGLGAAALEIRRNQAYVDWGYREAVFSTAEHYNPIGRAGLQSY